MRELNEIDNEMRQLEDERIAVNERIELLKKERADRLFVDFCAKYNLKKGDIVKTKSYGELQLYGPSGDTYLWILCRKIKNNGEPYQSTVTHTPTCFEDCEVVGHIDI